MAEKPRTREWLTAQEIQTMIDNTLAHHFTEYENRVIEPRHRETTNLQQQMSKDILGLGEKFRSLYRNGSGGPPGAVERLEGTMVDVQRTAKDVNERLTRTAQETREEMNRNFSVLREQESYSKGEKAMLVVAGTVVSTILSGGLLFVLNHFVSQLWK